MSWLRLAIKSLWNRKMTSLLAIFSLALSIALFLSVESIRRSAEEGFTQSISQIDLIVGARSGPMNLLLYSVFNIGNATNNISWQTYESMQKHPAVEWTFPYSLGDSHRGYRVVGTTKDFFTYFRYRGKNQIQLQAGQVLSSGPDSLWQAVIGSEVAHKLGYQLGASLTITHGVTKGEGVVKHDDKPFKVTGIMAPTGTAVDRSIYISLQGMEALHLDWSDGAVPNDKTRISPEAIRFENIQVKAISAFFLRTKSRIETLGLQREINEYKVEPLSAIIPGVTLNELWTSLDYIEKAFRAISIIVILVAFVSMLVTLLSTINERRREMAILRSLGVGHGRLLGLIVLESSVLSFLGVFGGLVLHYVVFWLATQWLQTEFGLALAEVSFSMTNTLVLLGFILCGTVIGIIPAVKAQNQSLKDGLIVST